MTCILLYRTAECNCTRQEDMMLFHVFSRGEQLHSAVLYSKSHAGACMYLDSQILSSLKLSILYNLYYSHLSPDYALLGFRFDL
jgi:hypothetical protein